MLVFMLFVVLVGVDVHFGMDVDMFLMLKFLVVRDGVDVAMFLMLVKT